MLTLIITFSNMCVIGFILYVTLKDSKRIDNLEKNIKANSLRHESRCAESAKNTQEYVLNEFNTRFEKEINIRVQNGFNNYLIVFKETFRKMIKETCSEYIEKEASKEYKKSFEEELNHIIFSKVHSDMQYFQEKFDQRFEAFSKQIVEKITVPRTIEEYKEEYTHYSTKEVADKFKISPHTINQWREKGILKHSDKVVSGKRCIWLFDRKYIDNFDFKKHISKNRKK